MPPRRRHDPAAIGDLLGRATRRLARANDSVLASVRAVWPEVTGAGTSTHAYPIRRSRAGVVTVACSDATWSQELGMQADRLQDLLAQALGDPDAVAGLRFVVADHAIPATDDGPRRPAPPPPPAPEATAAGAAAAAAIDDPALRDLVARAAARSIDRNKA